MIKPINTTNRPLNDDTPPNEAAAQQYPRVVVGRNNRPRKGSNGLGTLVPLKGYSTKLLLINHINTKTRRWSQQANRRQKTHRKAKTLGHQ